MGKTLIIVESPAKCKKIESYLGKDYKVIASYGHICKLSSLDQINFETYDIKFKNDKHKVIKTINQVRIEWGSHLSLGQCVCIGKDEYRVILITLILSIILMLNIFSASR